MKNLIVLALVIISLLFHSCNIFQFNNETEVIHIDNTNCKTIHIDPVPPAYTYNGAYIDTVYYLKLSNNPDALLGTINRMYIRNNYIYILDRWLAKSIKCFDMNGNYITSYGRIGQSPKEYIEPTDFAIMDSTIIVYDQHSSKMLYYNIDGQFIQSKPMPFQALNFVIDQDGNYVFKVEDNGLQSDQISGYRIIITDSTFNIKSKALYKDLKKYPSYFSDYSLLKLNDNIYTSLPKEDTVYLINGTGKINAIYNIDFGKYNMPKELLLSKNSRKYSVESNNDKYAFPDSYIVLKDFVLITYVYNTYRCQYLYSKDKDSIIEYYPSRKTPGAYSRNIYATDNTLVSFCMPSENMDMTDYIKQHKNEKETIINDIGKENWLFFEQLDEDDNLYLVFEKIKQF